MRCLLLLAMLFAACADSSSSAPTVEVSVRFGSYLDLDSVAAELTWPEQNSTDAKDILPHVGPAIDRVVQLTLDVPDGLVDSVGQLRVQGRRAGQTVAMVEVPVTPSIQTSADVTLVPRTQVVAPPFGRWRFAAQDAEGPDPVEVVSVQVPAASADRLLFISGALSGANQSIAQARIYIDDEEIDRFSHDLRGGLDAAAGFLTFEVLPAGPQRRLSIELVSPMASRLSQIRIVAVPVPAGADLKSLRDDENIEQVGRNLSLSPLTLDQPGQYLVLGKMSVTEAPSENTARGWLSLPDGSRRPLDEFGVSFSASRASLSPLFTAALVDVPAGGTTVQLAGHSSGTNGPSLNDWSRADADFRQQISVDPAPEGYAVRLVFDHAEQVARNRSRSDGRDITLVYEPAEGPPVRLHRVLDPDSGWNRADTTVWFRTPVVVPATGSTDFAMYFDATADGFDDPDEVFPFFDDFSSPAASAMRWRVFSGDGGEVSNGRLTFDGVGVRSAGPIAPEGARWEARLRLFDDVPNGLAYLSVGAEFQVAPTEFRFGAGLFANETGHFALVEDNSTPIEIRDAQNDHVFAVDRRATGDIRFFQDGRELASLPQVPANVATWRMSLINRGTSGASYDWVRARPYQEPEPGTALGELAGSEGLLPSRFRHRKLAAFRVDAWKSVDVVEGGATRETTTEPYRSLISQTLATSETPRLVIASARVAGANNVETARGGRVSLGSAVWLETNHRIDRDASDRAGYHHIAGVAEVVTGTTAGVVEVGITSPDGVAVSAADTRIIVLEFPP